MLNLTLEHLLELLDLEALEINLFRGRTTRDGRDRIFGGQVLGQALVAARRTVEDRLAHSLHGYFLRPGDPTRPIVYEVDRIRDGRSFATRRVVATQAGRAIFNMSVSFQEVEAGFEHQSEPLAPREPAGELYEEVIRREVARHVEIERDDRRFDLPIEVRAEGGLHIFDESVHPPRMRTWLRAKGALPNDPGLHQCVLAYASDLTIGVSAIHPHPVGVRSPGMRTASLDHAMWFHRPFRADDWLCFDQISPVASQGRGFGRGEVYTRKGELVASCAQESLMRREGGGRRQS
jgi:acyl-CoA thioesterase-2